MRCWKLSSIILLAIVPSNTYDSCLFLLPFDVGAGDMGQRFGSVLDIQVYCVCMVEISVITGRFLSWP